MQLMTLMNEVIRTRAYIVEYLPHVGDQSSPQERDVIHSLQRQLEEEDLEVIISLPLWAEAKAMFEKRNLAHGWAIKQKMVKLEGLLGEIRGRGEATPPTAQKET